MLELWRTVEPRRLIMEVAPADLLEHLASLTALPGPRATAWRAAALSGHVEAAIPLAEALRAAEALPDLAPSWLLWASLRQCLAAQLALIQCLLAPEGWPATLAERRDTLQRRRLGLAWLSYCPLSRLTDPRGWQNLQGAGERIPWGAETRPAPASPPTETSGPTLQVLSQIGDGASREGLQLGKVYGDLLTPLPLRGGTLPLDALAMALKLEFPNFAGAIDTLIGEAKLQRRVGQPWVCCRPKLLVGPPGVGKTRFARRFAAIAGLGYGEVSAAGAADTRALIGTARGWSSAQPCLPLLTMKRTGTANPVMCVDEVEKAGWSRHHGHIHDVLLRLLERQSSAHWFDEALLGEADLSQITWLLTANDLAGLPAPLLSRLTVVAIAPLAAADADTMAHSLLRDVADEFAVSVDDLPPLSDQAMNGLAQALRAGCSPRRIRRAIIAALIASPNEPPCH